MKRLLSICFVGLTVSLLVVSYAQADPTTLLYDVTDIGGGLYDYEFTLRLDDNDSTWAPGQGWAWIVFGDAKNSASPLTAFAGDLGDLPTGPYTCYGTTGGFHNGPTLGPVVDYWIPTAVGESLNWSGTSTAFVGPGDMLYSTLLVRGGAPVADFKPAEFVPVPGALILGSIGLGLAGFKMRKRKHV